MVMESKMVESAVGCVTRRTRRGRMEIKSIGGILATSLCLASWMLLLSCGGRQHAQDVSYHGNPVDPPSLKVLPTFPVSWESLSSDMRFGWNLAELAFEIAPPTAASGSDPAKVSQWSEQVLLPWLAEKKELVEHAREELESAASANLEERVIAAAIVALMYEDIAQVLRQVPSASRNQAKVDLAGSTEDVDPDWMVRAYVGHARTAYLACETNARTMRQGEAWSKFCGRRAGRL